MLLDLARGQVTRVEGLSAYKLGLSLGHHATLSDHIIIGLVGQRHGLDAIATFLQLDREQVLDWVCRLDLPVPHDRCWRPSRGLKAWAAETYLQFIECWTAGWHAASIGELLGRSVGAVWSKARWLGLPRRDRRNVIRVQASVPSHAEPRLPAVDVVVSKPERFVVTAVGSRLPILTVPNREHVLWTPELDEELANRYWANQHYEAIAVEWGLSARSIASRAHRLQLPRRERSRLVPHYDPAVVEASIVEARYVRRECMAIRGWFFWGQKNGLRTSRRGQRIQARSGAGYGYGIGHTIGGFSIGL